MAAKKIPNLTDPSSLSISYLHEMAVRGQTLYILILLAIAGSISLLPFIYVDVSVRGNGLLQAPTERSQLILPVNGRVSLLNIRENGYVQKGDTLMEIDATAGQQNNKLLTLRISELERLINDARHNADRIGSDMGQKASTQKYTAAWEQYEQQLENARIQLEQASREHERFRKLYDRKVVSAAEYERYQSVWMQAEIAHEGIGKQFRSQWVAEATIYRGELHELYRQQAEWKNQETYYTLTAPLSGTIQNLAGITPGAPVFVNQKIADISPDSTLVAMVYVHPKDIGLIRQGQEIRIQVDAFNYNQWGMLRAHVADIADDILLDAHNQPVFRVKCLLANSALTLSNGYVGQLKKGMTFQARFVVARRTLYQLLYDKVDDWLNPNIS